MRRATRVKAEKSLTGIRPPTSDKSYVQIHSGIVKLLEDARHAAARGINALMTASYWEIGRRIVEHEQGGSGRAPYGDVLIERLAEDLTRQFGRGFSRQNLWQMRAFYIGWSAKRAPQPKAGGPIWRGILPTTSGEFPNLGSLAAQFPLAWSAYVRLLAVKTTAAREFYEAEALRCGWTVRQLSRQIDSHYYERIALSRNKTAMLANGERRAAGDLIRPEEAIKDPFVLEFLGLKDEYSESELEESLIGHLTDFLLELGDDFAFIGRQRPLRIDDRWFRVDLLFYHRLLKCLVVIDIKADRFSHADAGQMHLYLNFAREHWMKPGENPPVGLILCASKGAAEAHYALEGLPNKVLATEYRTVLPDETLIASELERSRKVLELRRPARRD